MVAREALIKAPELGGGGVPSLGYRHPTILVGGRDSDVIFQGGARRRGGAASTSAGFQASRRVGSYLDPLARPMPGYASGAWWIGSGGQLHRRSTSEFSADCAPADALRAVQPGRQPSLPRRLPWSGALTGLLRRRDRCPPQAIALGHRPVGPGRRRSARVGAIEISGSVALPILDACRYAEEPPLIRPSRRMSWFGWVSAPLRRAALGDIVFCRNCPEAWAPARAGHKFWLGGVRSRAVEGRLLPRSAAPLKVRNGGGCGQPGGRSRTITPSG